MDPGVPEFLWFSKGQWKVEPLRDLGGLRAQWAVLKWLWQDLTAVGSHCQMLTRGGGGQDICENK